MQERLKLAAKLEAATGTVAATVRGMASSGLASEVDADVADAAALRASQDRLGLEAVLAAAKAQLNRLTGGPPAIVVEGVLEPLKGVIVALSAPTRLEVLALQEEHAALQRRVALLRREQVPNPTLSLYAQNDGFNERVLGVGLSVPIPLPQPIGRTRAGQLAETIALAQKAQAEIEGLQRELQAELTVASAEFEAASKARALYTAERIERAGVRLDAIAVQVKSARLPVRDALLAQQALVDQLKAHIDAREALCVASVRLRRAVGLSTEGDNL
jgi:cobalt-zinc-cadmium efflux system outer membrane protein